MFTITTSSPKPTTINISFVAALQQALVESGLKVCGLGKNNRGIFATSTSKFPRWKVCFNEAGEIFHVYRRDYEVKRWDDGGDPLFYYKELAKHIHEKAAHAKVLVYRASKTNGPTGAPADGPAGAPQPAAMTTDTTAPHPYPIDDYEDDVPF